ncbi:MAG: type III secretion inner membrane ring lipoprotein SctJ [Undibacterium umbellatum]|uniref:type III secretion system inner membrane ring lipoprotein SctJ n=1 Tax=Undibacterium umbellatum TaxID=2762300 RepID=UPI003BB75CB2
MTKACIQSAKYRRYFSSMFLLFFLCLLSACSEKVTLQAGLTDGEANEITALLNKHGMDARKSSNKEGIVLSVAEHDISRATRAMIAAGLPRKKSTNLGNIFKKDGMISTPLEERARYIYGLSAELEATLQQFDHVISARVHVVLPERIAPGEPIQPSSAAVFIKYQPPFDEDAAIPKMRNLVASSIPGLSGEEGKAKVSVVMVPAEAQGQSVEWTKVGPFSVQSDSARGLGWTIGGLLMLALVSGICAVAALLSRWPQRRHWARASQEQAGHVDNAVNPGNS